MKTPYGELNKGDIYVSADGAGHRVEVIDVDTYARVQDVVVAREDGIEYRIDWFKLMCVRYTKDGVTADRSEPIHRAATDGPSARLGLPKEQEGENHE